MIADHLQLQAGARLLHIGPHKTGTTAVQGAFHLARERLAARDVVYAGADRQPLLAALAVTGRPPLLGGPLPDLADWNDLVREVRGAGEQRVVVSSEFFAEATDATARRVIEDLGGSRVHVVVTLRSLTKLLPSQWQQYLQNGLRMPYLEWLEGILAQPPRTPTPGFWHRHSHDKLITRWAAAAGAQSITVIMVDESDRMVLLRTFESLLGLPGGFLIPDEETVNRSLTLAEAELVRLLNEEFRRQGWPGGRYSKFMRYGAVGQMKVGRQPHPGEPNIVTPPWALERAAEIGAGMARSISALGVRVIGDIFALGRVPPDLPQTAADAGPAGPAGPLIPAQAAAQAVIGALIAGGAGGQTTEEATCEVAASRLAAELIRRGRQRARRNLRLPGSGDHAQRSPAREAPRGLLDREASSPVTASAGLAPLPAAYSHRSIADAADLVERQHGRVVITRHGRPAAVVISLEDLETFGKTLDIGGSAALLDDIRKDLAGLDHAKAPALSKEDALGPATDQ